MSLVKKLAGETVIYGLGHILPRILHFTIFNTYLTYRVSRGEYAIYLDLYAYASILIVLFSYRMDTALFRFGKDRDKVEETYSTSLFPMFLSSMLLVVVGFAFSDTLANLLTYPGRGYYVKLFSCIIAFDVVALIPYARYRLLSKPKMFVGFKIANILITVLLVLIFLEWNPRQLVETYFPFIRGDIDLVFIANLIASAIVCVSLVVINVPKKVSVNLGLWRKMVRYAWPLIIVGLAASVNQFFAVPLQKYFLGAEIELNKDQSAIYGAAQKIASLLAMFTTAYNYAAEPFFFRHSDKSKSKQLYGEIALLFVIAGGLLSLVIFLYMDVFQIIVGPNFRSALYLVPVLLMSYLFLGLYYNVSIWYKLSDNTGYGAIIALIGAGITLTGSVAMLPVFGIDASAWTALICYGIMVVLAYVIGQIKYPIDYPIKRITTQLFLIGALLYVGYLIKSDYVLRNLLSGTAILFCYIGAACVLEGKNILNQIQFSFKK